MFAHRIKQILPPDQTQAKSLELIALDEFIQIDTQAFECNTKMIAKVKMVSHSNIVMFVIHILKGAVRKKNSMNPTTAFMVAYFGGPPSYPFHQLLQYLDFNQRLRMKSFLVSYNFDSKYIASAMIKTFDHLSERPFSHNFQYLIAKCQMVLVDDPVVSAFVVISKIASSLLCISLMLFRLWTNKVYLRKF